MPRIAKELTALEVKRLRHEGKGANISLPVGGVAGLMLQITANQSRSWLLRTTVGNRRREIGLGSFPEVSLAHARDRARLAKETIRQGGDPVEERRQAKARLVTAQRRNMEFREAVNQYLTAKLDQYKNEKHRQQWRNTLEKYAMPVLGALRVEDIEVRDVMCVLEPIWKEKTETASRLRGRIEAVLNWATVSGFRKGDNPARWQGSLKELLPAPARVAGTINQPALDIDAAPRWFAELRTRSGTGSRALEFAMLNASRSQEVRGACWDEFDLNAALWIIPAKRMKMGREHRVPLSRAALEFLRETPRMLGSDLVFPAQRGGQLSDMALSQAMRRIHEADISAGGDGYLDRVSRRPAVPHGLRSTFRDWVAERTTFPGEMAEIALAHKVGNAVEAAYRRGDMLERRRVLMEAWSDFLIGAEGR
jgi:integrase